MVDHLHECESIKNGHTISYGGGTIYFPNKVKSEECLEMMSKEDKEAHYKRVKEMEESIKKIEERIKEYEVENE